MAEQIDTLLDIEGACHELSLSPATIYRRLRDDSAFPRPVQYVKQGKRFWYRSELREYANACRVPLCVSK